MSKALVICESPAKAKTINKFLGNQFIVTASYGHVRDLPKNRLGFDPNNNYKPEYMVTQDKKITVKNLKRHIKPDTVIYLAADEDREGEAIAWHLIPTLGIENNPIKRIVFHEITKKAILHAVENPRPLDINMVDAQQARRILDRGVGYGLSPLLWKKVKRGLSAGRVQSAGLRIITDREDEIEAFVPEEYWKVKAEFNNPEFTAELVKIDGKKVKISDSTEMEVIKQDLSDVTYTLSDIVEKDTTRNPAPPFTTSTLQQEASRKFHMSVKNTMNVAQKLYEGATEDIPGHTGGLITYMRTDAVNLSDDAISGINSVIDDLYGSKYRIPNKRVYKSKAKGAQEAHEAIRPVNMSLTPSKAKPYLDDYQFKLYSLIWKRTVATQMAQAKLANTTYYITAKDKYLFTAKGQRVIFDGFMALYTESKDDNSDDDKKILPTVAKGTILDINNLLYEQNFTKPPARYSEASFVKKLETEGIGRPSTYGSTINTILSRKYVIVNEDKKLAPTHIGKIVSRFMKEQFGGIVDLKFTANIEERFDDIAAGKVKWTDVMDELYKPFAQELVKKESTVSRDEYKQVIELGKHPTLNNHIINVGYTGNGAYLMLMDTTKPEVKPKFAPIPKDKDETKLTINEAVKLFELPRNLGKHGDNEIMVSIGKFGPYAKLGKTYYPLKDKNVFEVSKEEVLAIINLIDEEKRKAIILEFKKQNIVVLNGRYGAYIKKGKANYKIPKGKVPKDLTLDEIKVIIQEQDNNKNNRKFKYKVKK